MEHKELYRVCTKCKKRKEHGKGQGWCKDCRNSHRRSEYNDNEEHRKKEIKESVIRQQERYQKNMKIVHEYKRRNPCVDCGCSDIRCLEFDHRDESKKSFTIGQVMQQKKIKAIMREIYKCDVRCANCHRIRHHEKKD